MENIGDLYRGNLRFKFIVPSYNSEKWIKNTLISITSQTIKNFDVIVIDDKSTDPNQQSIIKEHCDKYNSEKQAWKYIFNTDRKFALYNIVLGIDSIGCEDEDVIINVDGDDWLYNKNVLERVKKEYDNGAYLTYGQYIGYPDKKIGHCYEVTSDIIEQNKFRDIHWAFSHLRTFKYFLFKNIDRKDFIGPTGQYYDTAGDLALMYPMVEMAGDKIRFIPDILYVYNKENPLNDEKLDHKKQLLFTTLIKYKQKYTKYEHKV